MITLQQNESTAAQRRIPFFAMDDDSADNFTPKTGLTFTAPGAEVMVSKNGAAEASSLGTVTEVGGGLYYYEATEAELNTVGFLSIRPAKTDVYTAPTICQVVPYDPYNSGSLGLTTISTNLDATVSSRLPTASYQDVDDWLDAANSVETGLTLRQAFRIMAAILGGKLSGAGTGTEAFKAAVEGTTTRITHTVDSNGNRTAVSTNL